jgi:hypothetical protein
LRLIAFARAIHYHQLITEEETMALQIKQLVKRLAWLGYTAFEIRNIVREAIGDDDDALEDLCPTRSSQVIRHLQQYERLGAHYLLTYSK